MKKIEILGSGCPKCKKLTANVEAAVRQTGVEAEIATVTDLDTIISYGVMMTPGLVVGGQVKAVGKVLGIDEIAKLISDAEA